MNAIEEMRLRLRERSLAGREAPRGYDVTYLPQRATQNMAPRLPQSQIPSDKKEYTRPGRPSHSTPDKFRKYWERF